MSRVLIIDDQLHVRTAVTVALRQQGFDVVAVEDGPSALSAFDNDSFDAAVVDVFIPGVDGVTLAKQLRERNPKLGIVIISGVALKASGRTVLDFLPDAPELSKLVCLQKPFQASKLVQAVQHALRLAA